MENRSCNWLVQPCPKQPCPVFFCALDTVLILLARFCFPGAVSHCCAEEHGRLLMHASVKGVLGARLSYNKLFTLPLSVLLSAQVLFRRLSPWVSKLA